MLARRSRTTLALALAACAGPATPLGAPSSPMPDAMAAPATSTLVAQSDAGVGPSDADAARAPTDASTIACRTMDADLLALLTSPQWAHCRGSADAGAPSADPNLASLDIQVVASPAKIAPSATSELRIVMTNRAKVAITLFFDPEIFFAMTTLDARGTPTMPPQPTQRYVGGSCDPDPKWPPPAGPPIHRVTLPPGATVRHLLAWTPVRGRWSKPDGCGHVYPEEAGRLAPGRYTVVIAIPFLAGTAAGVPSPRVTIDVAK